ncbi:peptidase C48, SUMO/sentrin/Ubl1 [Tanacetum coccineum]
MEEAQKIAAAEKQVAEKARKEKADKEAAKKKKAELEKAEAKKKEEAKKEVAQIQAAEREKAGKEAPGHKKAKKKKSPAKKGAAAKRNEESNAAKVSKTFESPKVQEKMFEKGQESAEKSRAKRISKPSMYLKSMFMNKMVKTQDKLDEDEIISARSIFCMQGDISEVVFDDGKGIVAHKKGMQSLTPGIMIQKEVIDTFVTLLNYEERIRTAGKDMRRHYFPTNAVIPQLLNEDKDEVKEYESFENMMKNQMNTSESRKKMKDVNFAFFPTVAADGQYYVIVFNLLKANAVILDNEKDKDFDKYKNVFNSVKALFMKYLQKHEHPCAENLAKEKPTKVLKLKWKTDKNNIDIGLYTMMHMELYQGESPTHWKTDIVPESNRDYLTQMKSMRNENKEEEKVNKMIEDAIKKKIAEDKEI